MAPIEKEDEALLYKATLFEVTGDGNEAASDDNTVPESSNSSLDGTTLDQAKKEIARRRSRWYITVWSLWLRTVRRWIKELGCRAEAERRYAVRPFRKEATHQEEDDDFSTEPLMAVPKGFICYCHLCCVSKYKKRQGDFFIGRMPDGYFFFPFHCVSLRKGGLRRSCSKVTKTVSFSSVSVHEFSRVLGDNPAVSGGPPIAIGEKVPGSTLSEDLEAYESKRALRKSGDALKLSLAGRLSLLKEWDVSTTDMTKTKEQIRVIQRSRRRNSTALVTWLDDLKYGL